jgi:hypothetical protein
VTKLSQRKFKNMRWKMTWVKGRGKNKIPIAPIAIGGRKRKVFSKASHLEKLTAKGAYILA